MSVSFPHKPGPWTVDDLPDEGFYEIVDGALVVSPAPAPPHEVVCSCLHYLAGRAGPHRVLGAGGIEFEPVNYRVPDVIVLREDFDGMSAASIAPADVLLAVEVVSPSSLTTDRITKRAQYARAGIPAYWIVEYQPVLTVTALTLPRDSEVYVELHSWGEGQTVRISDPIAVSFDVNDLRG